MSINLARRRHFEAGERGRDYEYKHVFHRNSDTAVNREIAIDELKKYRSDCVTCKCFIKRIRVLLTELSQINLSEFFAVCEHCAKLAEGIKCKRCQYIINKFKWSNIQMAERHRRLRIWISKVKELQDLLDSQASLLGPVKNVHDLEELRRILNELFQPMTPRSTPRLCDWACVSLDKLYENKDIFQRILEQMRDENLVTLSGIGMGDANLGDGKSQALHKVPDNTPAQTIKTIARSDVTKISKNFRRGSSSKVPTQRRQVTQGRSEGAAQSPRTFKLTEGKSRKVQQKSIIDGQTEKPLPTGIKSAFTYQLSDRRFIENGWTILPTLKIERVYHIYEMTPVQSDDNWIALNKCKGVIYYDTGEILAIFKENDSVTWYYKNGMVALVYNGPKRPEDDDGSQLVYVLYSFEVDMRKKQTILAKFDYSGSGVVYDHQGNERLKYNQNSGELFDRNGAPTTWLWHSLNEPPTYRKRLIDTYERNPDPVLTKIIEENERPEKKQEKTSKIEMKNKPSRKSFVGTSERFKHVLTEITEDREALAQKKAKALLSKIEMENHAKKNETTFETYTIRMKRIMINEFFSLKVIRQAQIYLMFCDGSTRFRLDLGLEVNHKVTRREYVFVANENYNICDHMSQPSSILEQGLEFEQESLKESV